MTQILIVDDDAKIQSMLQRYLVNEGYVVQVASNTAQARLILKQFPVDLVLLDLRLGQEDGLFLLRKIRASGQKTGVIIVSGKADIIEKIVGLELGADDYVTKPFHLRELQARINTVLRRFVHSDSVPPSGSDAKVYFGPWELNLDRQQLNDDQGKEHDLTNGEFKLLEAFLSNPRRILSRDQLLNMTTGRNCESYDRTIDTQVRRLRKKIEKDPQKPQFIKTARGSGYIFSEKLTRKNDL